MLHVVLSCAITTGLETENSCLETLFIPPFRVAYHTSRAGERTCDVKRHLYASATVEWLHLVSLKSILYPYFLFLNVQEVARSVMRETWLLNR